MTAATVPLPTAAIPPGAPPLRLTLVLLPEAGGVRPHPVAPAPAAAAASPGWPEGEPTWEDAAWQ